MLVPPHELLSVGVRRDLEIQIGVLVVRMGHQTRVITRVHVVRDLILKQLSSCLLLADSAHVADRPERKVAIVALHADPVTTTLVVRVIAWEGGVIVVVELTQIIARLRILLVFQRMLLGLVFGKI